MEHERILQKLQWELCVKNAQTNYKLAENDYRSSRLKEELVLEGVVKIKNIKRVHKDSQHAAYNIKMAIGHLNWAKDGLNDFMDQSKN
jgi:hypothetical protein